MAPTLQVYSFTTEPPGSPKFNGSNAYCRERERESWITDETKVPSTPSWEREMATHSNILAWRVLWTEEPGGLLSMGSHRVGHD